MHRLAGILSRQFAVDEHFEIGERGGIGAAMVAVGAQHETGARVAKGGARGDEKTVFLGTARPFPRRLAADA